MPDAINEAFISIQNRNIFYRYRPGSSDLFISFLHGYPTSSLDYNHIIQNIPSEYHVLAHDHLGFGKSDKPTESEYLIFEQADIALEIYKKLEVRFLHIVAHNYGTSVATEIVARHNEGLTNFTIKSVTLCNGSMLIDLAKLRMIQRLLKNRWTGNMVAFLSTESTFQKNMRNIWFDQEKYSKADMSDHWKLLVSNKGKKVLPRITRYIDQRYAHYERWIGGLRDSALPFHILWAENDPVAVVEMAFRLKKIIDNARLIIIKNCGHYPMIEKSEEWTNHLMRYIKIIDHD